MDANRCSSRMDLGHPGSRSSVGPVAQCASGGTGAQSVSRFEAGAQAIVKGGPVDLEDHEARDCIEGLGTRTVGSAHVFGGSSQEGQDGGFRVSKCLFSPTRGLGCRSECENCPSPEFPGSVPDDVAERHVLEDALAKVRARAIVAPIGQLDECEKFCERAEKRVEKAQEAVAEALKVQTQREEELAEGKRRLEGLRAEAAAQPVPQPVIPGNDESTHLRSHVAQLEGDLRRQSHQFATEKISAETSLKQQVELLLQEVAALCLVPQRWRWCQLPGQDQRWCPS